MKLTESPTIRQTVSYNAEESGTWEKVIRNAMGTRTLSKFCEDSGLSVGYISRLTNGRLKSTPGVRTLAKIACSGAGEDKKKLFADLLKIGGHELTTEEMLREMRIAERTNELLEEERKDAGEEYDSMKLNASAIGLLFSRLMMMGVALQPQGYFGPDEGIEFGIKGYQFNRVIAISGFCGSSQNAVMAERDVLQKLLKDVSKKQDATLYLVLTDQREVFEFLSDAAKNTMKAQVYVLLANAERNKFVEQRFFAVNEEMQNAPFDFIKETN